MRKTVYKTNDEIEANLIKHTLENNNIDVYFEHEELKGVFDGLSAEVSTIDILVDEKDFKKAAKIIRSVEKQKSKTENNSKPNPVEFKNSLKLFIFGILIIITVAVIVICYIKMPGNN